MPDVRRSQIEKGSYSQGARQILARITLGACKGRVSTELTESAICTYTPQVGLGPVSSSWVPDAGCGSSKQGIGEGFDHGEGFVESADGGE